MKYLKMLGLAAVAAMAMTAFAAGSASATTLEVGGVTKNESITINASLKPGTSAVLRDTFGFSTNTCTESNVHGVTTKYTNPVTGPLTGHLEGDPEDGLNFGKCDSEVQVHDPGTLEIIHIANTTNGTVYSEEAEVTSDGPFGILTCVTGETTKLGTLTGKLSGHAEMDINATLDCGISAKWVATYLITSPTGLGVSA